MKHLIEHCFVPLFGAYRGRVIVSGKPRDEFRAWLGNSSRFHGGTSIFVDLLVGKLSSDERRFFNIPLSIEAEKHTKTVKGHSGAVDSPFESWDRLTILTRAGSVLSLLKDVRERTNYDHVFGDLHLYEVLFPTHYLMFSHLTPESFGFYLTDFDTNLKAVPRVVFEDLNRQYEHPTRGHTDAKKKLIDETYKKSLMVGEPLRSSPAFYYAEEGIFMFDAQTRDRYALYSFEPFENRENGARRTFWASVIHDMQS